MPQITVNASSIGGLIHLEHTGPVHVPPNGLITIDPRDLQVMLNMGALPVASHAAQPQDNNQC